MLTRLRDALAVPVDPASFLVFRVGFGLLAAFASLRFVAYGWVEELLLRPDFLFSWFSGLPVLSAPWLYGVFGLQLLAGVGIALGWRVRWCLLCWVLSFGYVELLDKTLYLNHYVLFSLLGLWLLVAPVDRVTANGQQPLPRWVLWLLRLQVGSVYVWAGVAKLNADWLFEAQPLTTWLAARVDIPWVGPLLAQKETAFAMSWGGAVYDLCIPFLLLFPPTRWFAFALVVIFHFGVWLLFPIGVFPWLMILSATLLLPPSWPRKFWSGLPRFEAVPDRALTTLQAFFWGAAAAAIVALPGRAYIMDGDVSWTERGYRFAWRVMLNEKTGLVDFRVTEKSTGRVWRVFPSHELTELQHKQMRTQPDMIRDYALHLKGVHEAEGRDVAVYADAWVSLNGRPSQRLIRPDVDVTLSLKELERLDWIEPLLADPAGSGI